MASETLMKCMHGPCQCLVEAEQKFCSAACSSARATGSLPCACGHPGCVGEHWAANSLVEDDVEDEQYSNE
jgi:metallothionein